MYTVSQLLEQISFITATCPFPDSEIISIAYDTRKIRVGSSSLFFALKGQRDGHYYIADAYQKGVRSIILSDESFDTTAYPAANFIWVRDTLKAMQTIARFHRMHFHYPFIGITGSNGKTIVKEWLYTLLKDQFNCYQSPKSYNSQLGVAFSLWQLNEQYNLALIEAGISQSGEMQALGDMIQPTWGIFTSLGNAHQEGFSSKIDKIAEKWKLFQNVKKIFAPSEELYEDQLSDPRLISWGTNKKDTLSIKDKRAEGNKTLISCVYQDDTAFTLEIPFIDAASIENALTCSLVLLDLGYSIAQLQENLYKLRPLEMRLQLKKGKNQTSIIDDTYSNDLASLQIALDFLAQQNQYDAKKLIISDLDGQNWDESSKSKLVEILNRQHLDEILLVGERIQELVAYLSSSVTSFSTTTAMISYLRRINWKEATILIKGARKFHLEKVSKLLVEKSHETILEINLKALEHNLNQYRAHIRPRVKLMVMVKAFSYGSGSFEVANILQFHQVDYLTVAFVDEGAELRRGGITLPIMVLSPHESTFDDLVAYSLEPEIYSIHILRAFVEYLDALGIKDYPIHIKMDTGMHRLGFMEAELAELFAYLQQHDAVRVASTFSHLVGAGDPQFADFTLQQIAMFKKHAALLEDHIGYKVIKHICNTSGIIHHPEAHLDMVRLGIGLYGYDMAPKNIQLEQVSTLKTTISQIKHLPSTETVGYDRKGVLQRDSTIATVKIGYADGYNRRLGNGVGRMLINGKQVPTVGNICMDMCMLDITDIEANEGDEVIVFPDLAQIAKEIGTIPYELLTGISSRVKRVYFYE